MKQTIPTLENKSVHLGLPHQQRVAPKTSNKQHVGILYSYKLQVETKFDYKLSRADDMIFF